MITSKTNIVMVLIAVKIVTVFQTLASMAHVLNVPQMSILCLVIPMLALLIVIVPQVHVSMLLALHVHLLAPIVIKLPVPMIAIAPH